MTNYRTAFGYLPLVLTGLVSMGIHHRVRVGVISAESVGRTWQGIQSRQRARLNIQKLPLNQQLQMAYPEAGGLTLPLSYPQNRAKTAQTKLHPDLKGQKYLGQVNLRSVDKYVSALRFESSQKRKKI